MMRSTLLAMAVAAFAAGCGGGTEEKAIVPEEVTPEQEQAYQEHRQTVQEQERTRMPRDD